MERIVKVWGFILGFSGLDKGLFVIIVFGFRHSFCVMAFCRLRYLLLHLLPCWFCRFFGFNSFGLSACYMWWLDGDGYSGGCKRVLDSCCNDVKVERVS